MSDAVAVDESSGRAAGSQPTWWVVAGVAAAVATLCGLVASGGTVPGWEASIFHTVNDLPDCLDGPMWVFQLAGLLFVPILVAIGAAAFRKWRLAVALVALVPLKLLVEHLVVKQLVERERPATSICDLPAPAPGSSSVVATDCIHLRGDVPIDGLSFVSGHAVIAWGVATILWPALPPRWRWVPVVVATLNAVARVYLGAHNPLDVIGGGAIGVTVGALLVVAVRPEATRQVT